MDETGKLVKGPPSDFKFSTHMAMKHINVAMEEDANLRAARFELVPHVLDERTFWSAYFWEVEQIKLQVTDDIQTLNHEEMLADMAFAKFGKSRHQQRIQATNKIYESCTSSSIVRGVVLREHVRRKMAKHNSEEQVVDRFRAIVHQARSQRKVLKRVSFSFDSDSDTQSARIPSPETLPPPSALKVSRSMSDPPKRDSKSDDNHPEIEIEPPAAQSSTSSSSDSDSDSDSEDTDVEDSEGDGVGVEMVLDGSLTLSGSAASLSSSKDVRVVRRTASKVVRFFVPPVLLIPAVIGVRLLTALVVAMGSIVIGTLRLTKSFIVKCLSSVVRFHRWLLLGVWSGLKYWVWCLFKFAKLIVSYIGKGLSLVKMVNVVVVKRIIHGTALVISKTRGSVKQFFVQLRRFSLQPLVYISFAIRQLIYLPVTIGRRVVKRSEKTTDYIKKNKDDTMDILIAILGLGVLFLIATGVLFPFIHDIFTGNRVPTLRFEPVRFPSLSVPTFYLPSLDLTQKKSFTDVIASFFN